MRENIDILELVSQRRKETPEFFKDPKWPLTLADEIATAQPELVETKPVLIRREFRVSPEAYREMVKNTGCCRGFVENPDCFAIFSPMSGTLAIKNTPGNIEEVRKWLARHGR